MKGLAFAFMALLLLADIFCLAEEAPDPFAGRWQDPVYGRAVLRIWREGADYDIRIRWGNSADSEGVWRMRAAREGDRLVYTDGSMAIVTYAPGGGESSEEAQYTDAAGSFTLDGEGRLLWADTREARAPEFAFERAPMPAPDAKALAGRFFEPVASQTPGAAGASLKQAQTAAEVLRFVGENMLCDVDVAALRENLREAWTGLDDATRRRFDEDRPGVFALVEAALAGDDSLAGLFEDAGAEDARVLAADEEVRQGWRALLESVQAMGE